MPRKKRPMLWQLFNGVAAALVIGYLGLALFSIFFSDKMIFPAPEASYVDDKDIIKLPIGQQQREISALYLENPEAKFTILYSHGNGEDLGNIRPFLEELRDRGYAVFAYDYPGYGTSEGRPSERGCFEAASAAFSYLVILRDVEPDSIILFGRSLGSGPSYFLASQKAVAGLIIDGGFTSTFRVITRGKILPWDKFDNLALVDKVHCPTLFLHGKQDVTVPFAHAETMYAAAREPKMKLFVDEAGHNNLIECAGPRYWDAIQSFTQSLREPHE